MTQEEMKKLKEEFGDNLSIAKTTHLHDENDYNYSNKYIIAYKNIIVGSELVDYDFVKNNILKEVTA